MHLHGVCVSPGVSGVSKVTQNRWLFTMVYSDDDAVDDSEPMVGGLRFGVGVNARGKMPRESCQNGKDDHLVMVLANHSCVG